MLEKPIKSILITYYFRIAALSLTSCTLITFTVSLDPVMAQRDSSLELAQTNQLELNNLLLKGKQHVEEQDYDQALETYQQAATLDRQNSQIFSGIGYVQTLRKDYDAAVAAYKQAIALAPNEPKLYYALGYSLGNAGENLAAAKAYEKAIELEPDNIQNHLGLGVVLLREREYDRAIEAYYRVLALAPDNEQAYKIVSSILIEQQRYPEASKLLQTAIKRYPQLVELQLYLANVLFDQGNIAASLQALEVAKQTDPQNHLIYLRAGDIRYQKGNLDTALTEYQQALRLRADSAPALEGKGKIYLAKQDYFKAIIAFRRLTEIAPNNPSGYQNLGVALKARNRKQEAIAALNQALKLYKSEGNTQEANTVVVLIEEINGEQ